MKRLAFLSIAPLLLAGCFSASAPLESLEETPETAVPVVLRCETHANKFAATVIGPGTNTIEFSHELHDAKPGEVLELRATHTSVTVSPHSLVVKDPSGTIVFRSVEDRPTIQSWENKTLFSRPAQTGLWSATYETGAGVHADIQFTWVLWDLECNPWRTHG